MGNTINNQTSSTQQSYDEHASDYEEARDGAKESTPTSDAAAESSSESQEAQKAQDETQQSDIPEQTEESWDYESDAPEYDAEIEEDYEQLSTEDGLEPADEDLRRQKLLAQLNQRLKQAQKNGQQAMKDGDAQKMENSVMEVMEIMDDVEEPIDQFQKDKQQSVNQKKQELQLKKLDQQLVETLKRMRQQVGTRKTWKNLLQGQTKKAFKSKIHKEINNKLADRAHKEQKKTNDCLRKKAEEFHTKFSPLNRVAKGASEGKDGKKQTLTAKEKMVCEEEALEDGYEGVGDLHNKEKEKYKKFLKRNLQYEKQKATKETKTSVKELKQEAAKKAHKAEAGEGEESFDLQEAWKKMPSAQEFEKSVQNMLQLGLITPEQAEKSLRKFKDRMDKFAARQEKRLTKTGPGILVARDDEEEKLAIFRPFTKILGLFYSDEDEENTTDSDQRLSQLRFDVSAGLTTLETGRSRQVEVATTKQKISNAQLDIEVEDGLLAWSRILNHPQTFVSDMNLERGIAGHASHWTRMQSILKENSEVLVARLQSQDPDAIV